jgi:hypothetical protein
MESIRANTIHTSVKVATATGCSQSDHKHDNEKNDGYHHSQHPPSFPDPNAPHIEPQKKAPDAGLWHRGFAVVYKPHAAWTNQGVACLR